MAKIAEARGVTMAQVALDYLLAKPAVTSLTGGTASIGIIAVFCVL